MNDSRKETNWYKSYFHFGRSASSKTRGKLRGGILCGTTIGVLFLRTEVLSLRLQME